MDDSEAERFRIYALQDGAIRAQALTFSLTKGIFELLSSGPRTFDEISLRLGISRRVLPALLAFLCSNGLLELARSTYANTPAASRFLVRASPAYIGGRAFLFVGFYDAIGHLPASLTSGEPWTPEGQHDMFGGFSDEQQQWFADGMFANAARGAEILLEQVDFSRFGSLMDVGGNAGGYAIPIARAQPGLRITILDLPALEPLARARVAETGVEQRIEFRAGSFFEPLPTDSDCILLSSILHDWDDADCHRILANCNAALRPGGSIVVTEPMLSDDFTGPDHPAASGLTMALLGGQNRTRPEVATMLEKAGFGETWSSELLPQNSVVTAKRMA